MWWIGLGLLVLLFLFWADRRTRGRGSVDRNGIKDHPTGPYI